MSQTTTDQCPVPSPTFDTESYQIYAHRFQEEFVIIGLLGGLYGVLTLLSITSGYALIQRSGRIQPTVIVLCLTILALFASTTTYMVACILYYQSDFLDSFIFSTNSIWTYDTLPDFSGVPPDLILGFVAAEQLQACASAATLTINLILGDAIVCWRACVVWHKNHVVKAICGAFLLATFILGVVDTTQSCHPSESYDYIDNTTNAPGILFEGLPIGIAACVLSLSTNLFATLLVAYKAWESRRRLKGYLVTKVGGSPVEKLLALLIESGAVYSAIWAVVVAFQVGDYNFLNGLDSISTVESNFLDIFGVIMNGALVPMIAIYPTIIIVLVALNRSHMERGLTQHPLEDMPTPHLAMTVNTIATSLHQSRSHRRSDVLAIDEQESRCGDASESEDPDASRRTSQEGKVEVIGYSRLPLDP